MLGKVETSDTRAAGTIHKDVWLQSICKRYRWMRIIKSVGTDSLQISMDYTVRVEIFKAGCDVDQLMEN